MNKDRIYSAQNRRQLVSKFKAGLLTYLRNNIVDCI